MGAIKTLHAAFLHEMSDMLNAETQLTDAMNQMHGMASNTEVKDGLQMHIEQTQEQIKNLHRAFEALGEKPEEVTCKGVQGLVAEFKSAAKEMKAPELLDGLILDAGLKSEHYEMATYHGLVEKAKLMGHTEAARLLETNMKMEQQFAKQLEQIDKKLGKQIMKKPELVGHAA